MLSRLSSAVAVQCPRRAILRETGSDTRRRRLELLGRGVVWIAQILTRLPVLRGALPAATPWRIYGVTVVPVAVLRSERERCGG